MLCLIFPMSVCRSPLGQPRQMTRACLIHALHPDEEKTVILRVSYARPGVMRVGVEAMWRAAGPAGAGTESTKPRMLSGWDRDMPAVRKV